MIFKKPIFWKDINSISLFLLPLSIITLLFNYLKSLVIEEYKFKIPIICVGNFFTGGTGKTPLSIFIYNLLKKRNYKPAIIKKYYSSHLDEINFTKEKVKNFFSDKKRSTSILKAIQKRSSIAIMDDGLQDLSIKKDINIVCFNSTDCAGNEFLMPAGPLRERLKKLKDCHIVVINGKKNIAFEKKLKKISSNIKIYQSVYKIKNIHRYKDKRVLAFAGIGNPEGFFNLLKINRFLIKDKISFPDHYNYSREEIENIILRAKKKGLKLLTTEKDYFRIRKFGFKKIDYISIDLKIIKHKNFEQEVLKNL